MNAGINDFLSKPFKEEELYKKIVGLTGFGNTNLTDKIKHTEK